MNEWRYFEPADGWAKFAESSSLTDAIWKLLPEKEWHYMNLTTGSSVWESRQDASMVQILYEGEKIIALTVQPGLAITLVNVLVQQFKLLATST